MSSSTQSGLTTQIRTRPRATQQGCVNCRRHVTVPAVLTHEAIPEDSRGGRIKKYRLYGSPAAWRVAKINLIIIIIIDQYTAEQRGIVMCHY